MEVTQISKILRDEAKSINKDPLIKNIRKTKNNNIEIKTIDQEIDTISALLKNKSTEYEIINPADRMMKIILLRVSRDFTKEEVEEEIKKKNYLHKFNILKNIENNNQQYWNWIIEAPAEDCRKLVKQKTLKLFYELIRIEFYIRIIRCTKC